MSLRLVGISHRTAPIEVRERFYVGSGERAAAASETLENGPVRECVVLSTCNRTEYYLRGPQGAAEAAESVMVEESGFPSDEVGDSIYRLGGREVAEHLFRVASGLDSMVLGEAEIQGQVGDAYRLGRRECPEAVGPVLHRLFQQALSAGGRVRSETRLSEGAASVPTAAVNLAEKVHGSLRGRTTLVVGAGDMGTATLRCLVDRGVQDVRVTSRTAERADRVAAEVAGTSLPMASAWEQLGGIDILVACTASAEPILPADRVRDARAGSERPLVVLDIAVPRDVESRAGELPEVFLYNIDDLQRVVEDAEEARRDELGPAERLLEEEVADFWQWYRAREAVPLIRALRDRAERIREREIEQALEDVGSLSESERERIRGATRLVLKRLLHEPTVGLRRLAERENGTAYLEVAKELFDLEPEESGE